MLAPLQSTLLSNIGNATSCNTERRKIGREGWEVNIVAVLADRRMGGGRRPYNKSEGNLNAASC